MNRVLRLRRESLGFAIGSALFAVGACPGYFALVGEQVTNITFFIGSVFFTMAGFIQLRLTGRWQHGAWKSKAQWDDWWSAAVQFLGTLFFNISTFSALFLSTTSAQYLGSVWRPDARGSICFLISATLAVIATTHTKTLWDPEARNWWNTWLGVAGAILFAISAVAAWVEPGTADPLSPEWVNLGTFLGAICFLVGALLVKPPREEAAAAASPGT
ncbi:MAG: hypothetical protein WBP55_05600 [Solirubrobacterales bacterium]